LLLLFDVDAVDVFDCDPELAVAVEAGLLSRSVTSSTLASRAFSELFFSASASSFAMRSSSAFFAAAASARLRAASFSAAAFAAESRLA